MKNLFFFVAIVSLFTQSSRIIQTFEPIESVQGQEEETANDWLFRQRAYPHGEIDMQAFRDAVRFRETKKQNQHARDETWNFEGPINVGGRVVDIEMIPGEPGRIYVGAASGGIFRSDDFGITWLPIFDDQPTLSIGDMAIAPNDNEVMYVGTGEANAGGGSLAYDGLGVFRTDDGGDHWEAVGLEGVGSIGRIMIDPVDPNRAYVAAMGTLFANNEERGVYRTMDGGQNWEQVLFVSDSTGAIDLALHPDEPMTLYATMWERVRRPEFRKYHGPTSGLYKSIDGGDTWTELTEGLPALSVQKGRMSVAIAPSDPDVIYTAIANETGMLENVYRSTDAGENWMPLGLEGLTTVPFEWWFNKLVVSPENPQKIFYIGYVIQEYIPEPGVWLTRFQTAHVDQHALWIDPNNADLQLMGNDGGLHFTDDGGITFTKWNNLPITQFYTCEMDNQFPERLYGGTQDNGTQRTLTGNNNDWARINGGDGFRVLVNPENNSLVYAESQYGRFKKSIDGGAFFVDAVNGIPQSARKNWNTPFIMDPNNPSTICLGTEQVFRTQNDAFTWEAISPDLTNGSGGGNLVYGTITSLSISPLDNEVIWAGTDDGNLWVTPNGGDFWLPVAEDLPNRWVTSVTADPNNSDGAYVTFSGYRYGTDMSHIYHTNDLGNNWQDISGDLPDIPINDFEVNPADDQLFIASDIGVFYSVNGGITWDILGDGLPSVVITDIKLHLSTNTLLAGTYGRSMWTVNVEGVVSTKAPDLNSFMTISPNPFTDYVALSFAENFPSGEYQMQLISTTGQLAASRELTWIREGQALSWALPGLTSGVYFLVIKGDNGRTVQKLVRG